MITKIRGEQPFQVLTNNFSISPSSQGYTLQISADGVNFTNLFAVAPNTTRLVTGVAANSYYRLSGNDSEVVINWMKTCVTEGGGGDLSNYYTKEETDEAIQEAIEGISGGTVDLSGYSTTVEVEQMITDATSGMATEAYVQEQGYLTSADTADFLKQEDLADYWNSGETQNAINLATSGMATETFVQSQGFLTSADTANFLTSADTANFLTETDILPKERAISEALNDLNDRVVELSGQTVDFSGYWTSAQTQNAIDEATEDFVSSGQVATQIQNYNFIPVSPSSSIPFRNVWGGTQEDYDIETQSGTTADWRVIYIITPSN